MRKMVVEEDVASGARILRAPQPPILGARSFMSDKFLEKLQAHDLAMYRALCPLNPEMYAGLGVTRYPGRLPESGG